MLGAALFAAVAAVAYLGYRALGIWDTHLVQTRTQHDARESRMLDLMERRVKIKEAQESRAGKPSEIIVIPEDLKARIGMWDEPFAQDEEEGTIRRLYAETQDWNAVRRQLPTLKPFGMDAGEPQKREGMIQ